MIVIFFFQAEDGIRDLTVTGVQTCALPICYKFQFVTLSAFHVLNHAMFELARAYRDKGMAAYAELQGREFAAERDGYAAVRHQEFVGVGYFDEITQIATGGQSSVTAMEGSTEQEQFGEDGRPTTPAGR